MLKKKYFKKNDWGKGMIEAKNIKLIMVTSDSVTFEIEDGGIYYLREKLSIYLNGEKAFETEKTVNSVYDLMPDTDYHLEVKNEEGVVVTSSDFSTDTLLLEINVKDIGAYGDGIHDDTSFIQAAIMACPRGGKVVIPEGNYLITSIFLSSHLRLELKKNARLLADVKRENRVHFPGSIKTSNEENDEYHLGTWEGDPFPMFAGIISGIKVKDVVIYGEGVIDGQASIDNWWHEPKKMNVAYRPRMLFLNHCKNVKVQGVTFMNSPAWVIHPFFSKKLLFVDLTVNNPKVSPNTDGLDPESCDDVDIVGIHFSLGDDCIAIKSGKFYMGQKYKHPSNNVHIWQCLMENGHGAVTLGSEIAGGVTNVLVEKCLFKNTDRGLRIKTRRGRGRQCYLNNIKFEDITMDEVMNPFTANMFYFCDPDGHEEYVQSKELYPVDERTPKLGVLEFTNIKATNAKVSAAYFLGLPESKIEAVIMKNVDISFGGEEVSEVPIMCDSVEKMSKRGIVAENVNKIILENVSVTGQDGLDVELINVDEVKRS